MATTTAQTQNPTKGRTRHSLKLRQYIDPEITSVHLAQDHEVVQRQLDRALALALDAVGFDEAEPLAFASFRALVEEYMSHFLRTVNQNMCASRRRMPVPLDFQTALAENNLTLRSLLPHIDPPVYGSSSRSPSPSSTSSKAKRRRVLSSKSQVLPSLHSQPESSSTTYFSSPSGFSTSVTGASDSAASRQEATLEAILNSGGSGGLPNGTGPGYRDQQQPPRPANVPAGFPALPSQHTYRSRPVFAIREKDPQRIREQATEEGRLGEEALRRLAAKQAELRKAREEQQKKQLEEGGGLLRVAGAMDMSRSASGARSSAGTGASTRKRKAEREEAISAHNAMAAAAAATLVPAVPKFRSQADDMFKNLMSSLGGGEEAGADGIISATDSDRDWNGGLNEPINSERIYWRQTPRRGAANG